MLVQMNINISISMGPPALIVRPFRAKDVFLRDTRSGIISIITKAVLCTPPRNACKGVLVPMMIAAVVFLGARGTTGADQKTRRDILWLGEAIASWRRKGMKFEMRRIYTIHNYLLLSKLGPHGCPIVISVVF